MSRSSSRRLLDFIVLVVLLGGAGFVMYNLLPQRTLAGQDVVPPLPVSASDPLQAFLTAFIVMTAVGAPVTGAIVLAVILKGVSKSIPVDASTPDRPVEKQAALKSPKELSKGEALFWKIAATVLILGLIGGLGLALWPSLVQLFS